MLVLGSDVGALEILLWSAFLKDTVESFEASGTRPLRVLALAMIVGFLWEESQLGTPERVR